MRTHYFSIISLSAKKERFSLCRLVESKKSPKVLVVGVVVVGVADDPEEEEEKKKKKKKKKLMLRKFIQNVLLIFGLLLRLLRFLRVTWIVKFLRLLLFSALLLPAFVRIGWFYATDGRIERGVRYGKNARNFLDVYVPSEERRKDGKEEEDKDIEGENKKQPLKPVVIFVTGGVWIIGYRVWGALLAKSLL